MTQYAFRGLGFLDPTQFAVSKEMEQRLSASVASTSVGTTGTIRTSAVAPLREDLYAIKASYPAHASQTLIGATTASAQDASLTRDITAVVRDSLPSFGLQPAKSSPSVSTGGQLTAAVDGAANAATESSIAVSNPDVTRIGITGQTGLPWGKIAVGGLIALGVFAAIRLLR